MGGINQHSIQFHPESSILLDSGHRWNAFPNEPTTEPIQATDFCMDLHVTPDGKRILAAVGKSIHAWDETTHVFLRELLRDELNIDCFAISHDGQRLVTGNMGRSKENRSTLASSQRHSQDLKSVYAMPLILALSELPNRAEFTEEGRPCNKTDTRMGWVGLGFVGACAPFDLFATRPRTDHNNADFDQDGGST